MSIELHIERLVIDAAALGGEPAAAVRRAIERELGQRLMQPGAAEALRGLDSAPALPAVGLPAVEHPRERLGSRVARAVQQGLGIPAPAAGARIATGSSHG